MPTFKEPLLHPNHAQAIAALREDPGPALAFIARQWVILGAKAEWSMDMNRSATEGLAHLATFYNVPEVGDQSDQALAYWGRAAEHLGYPSDREDI
jgi:hypothetical protein